MSFQGTVAAVVTVLTAGLMVLIESPQNKAEQPPEAPLLDCREEISLTCKLRLFNTSESLLVRKLNSMQVKTFHQVGEKKNLTGLHRAIT